MPSTPDKPPTPISSLPDLATPQEVASVLRCTARFVQAEIVAGRLGASKIAGRYLVSPAAVAAYIERQQVPSQDRMRGQGAAGGKTTCSGKPSGASEAFSSARQRAHEVALRLRQSGRKK